MKWYASEIQHLTRTFNNRHWRKNTIIVDFDKSDFPLQIFSFRMILKLCISSCCLFFSCKCYVLCTIVFLCVICFGHGVFLLWSTGDFWLPFYFSSQLFINIYLHSGVYMVVQWKMICGNDLSLMYVKVIYYLS